MDDTASTADLVRQATQQVSTLVRDELKLAQAEITGKAKIAGKGAGMFGGAAAVAFYGLGALLLAIGLGLANVMPDWLAALIVAIVLFALGALLALLGRNQLRRAAPPTPDLAIHNVRADLDTVGSAISDRRQP
jgi:hypothetical protein